MRKLKTSNIFNLTHEGQPTSISPIEREVVDDLRSAGLDIFTTQQLRAAIEPYPEAIPVLLKHLRLPQDVAIKDTMIRSLTVKEAKGIAFEQIYQMYLNETDHSMYGVIDSEANALAYLAEKKDIPKLIGLALDPKYGRTREYFVKKIASSAGKDNLEQVRSCLLKLKEDENQYIASDAKRALERKKFT